MAIRIAEQAGRTDVGRQRSANEDTLVLSPPFFGVADGMGGARAGEVASALAAGVFAEVGPTDEPPEAELTGILKEANRRIYELAASDEAHRGMGTTLTAAKVVGDEVSLGHVGDSRAYLLRDGDLEQLTRDHSLVAELERTGQITAEAAENHPQRSIITRALGPESSVEVDTYTVAGRDGDIFLICSDGLTGMVGDEELAALLRAPTTLEETAEALVRAANQSGGRDNITVVLFRLGDDGVAAEASDSGGEDAGADAQDTIAGTMRAEDVQAAAADQPTEVPQPTAPPATPPAPRGRSAVAERLAGAAPDSTVVRPPERAPVPRARPRRRGARARGLARLVVALVLLAGVGAGLYALSRQVYFVATNDGGLVTVYRGIPYELPFGINLYKQEYASGVPARAIPATRRGRVLDHSWRSREDAVDLVRQVERGRLDPGSGG
jgi:serine/threonine protein phosphatase PrpC